MSHWVTAPIASIIFLAEAVCIAMSMVGLRQFESKTMRGGGRRRQHTSHKIGFSPNCALFHNVITFDGVVPTGVPEKSHIAGGKESTF